MKYDDSHVCMKCLEVYVPRAGTGAACPACESVGDTRPLRRALLEGRKLEDLPDLLTEEELAWWLGVEQSTVQSWRYEGLVPDFLRIGRRVQGPVRYDHQSIRAFMESRRVKVPVTAIDNNRGKAAAAGG